MARVTVIGGGITGLAAAYQLQLEGGHEITLLEGSDRLGGKLSTHREQGMIVEAAADSIFTHKPAAIDLIGELGLEEDLMDPIGSGFSVLVGGTLYAIPRSVVSFSPRPEDLAALSFLTGHDRARILAEPTMPKGSGGDESISDFFRRRFGQRFTETIAAPLFAGIHAGDPERLSMRALYPSLVEREQSRGRLGGPSVSGQPGFKTLKPGMDRLVQGLVRWLTRVEIRAGCGVGSVELRKGKLTIDGAEADAAILAVPSFSAARLLREVSSAASQMLKEIRHVSTAVVTLALRLDAIPGGLHENGFLVSSAETLPISGCTFSSSKWANRVPEGVGLIRAFVGQEGRTNIDPLSDRETIQFATESVSAILRIESAPFYSRVDRWPNAMPQYDLGHLELMDRIEDALSPLPIWLAGTSYRGTGIPDCIRQGREAARSLTQ